MSAAASGPDAASGMQIYVDGIAYATYANVSSLPAGTTVTLPSSGTHRVAVQSYDTRTSTWVKSVVYVTAQ
jgi:predicted 2-oxoglutarate/Fe(II)-dependent dioxygenase YbiX